MDRPEDTTTPPDALPREDLADLYENAPCGYLSLDRTATIVKVNATLTRWLGCTAAELEGRPFQTLLNTGTAIFFNTHILPLLRLRGHADELALDLGSQTGSRLPVLVNAAERRDAAGNLLFTRLTIFNATNRRQFERDLMAERDTATAAHQAQEAHTVSIEASLRSERETAALREQFIAVLGHDLRNPLAALISGVRMLREASLDDGSRTQLLEMMRTSGWRMNELIENILDFARGRLGDGLTLEVEDDVHVESVLGQVTDELRLGSPNGPIDVQYALSSPVRFDPRRISQLYSNLLGNALTHGKPGVPIRVLARTRDDHFELAVSNASDPIPPAALDQLFQPFFRGAVRPSQQGLGLGLYISAQIARAHGGTVAVQSAHGETCFTFRMPLVASGN